MSDTIDQLNSLMNEACDRVHRLCDKACITTKQNQSLLDDLYALRTKATAMKRRHLDTLKAPHLVEDYAVFTIEEYVDDIVLKIDDTIEAYTQAHRQI